MPAPVKHHQESQQMPAQTETSDTAGTPADTSAREGTPKTVGTMAAKAVMPTTFRMLTTAGTLAKGGD
jgi:hypothetical protein